MNERDFTLPDWALAEVQRFRSLVDSFNKKVEPYNQLPNLHQKAKVLGEALAMLAIMECAARRFQFFTNSSGLSETRATLELEARELGEKGLKVEVAPFVKLVNVLFVDTESTGLGKNDQPVSIGLVLTEVDVSSGFIVREISAYYGLNDPSCEISPDAFRIHGLSKSKLSGLEFDYRELVNVFGVADLIVAHNSKFDRRMLRFLDKQEYNWGCSCWDIDWPGEIGGRSLDSICNYFSITRESPHNALADTRSMISVLQCRQIDGSPYLLDLLKKHWHSKPFAISARN